MRYTCWSSPSSPPTDRQDWHADREATLQSSKRREGRAAIEWRNWGNGKENATTLSGTVDQYNVSPRDTEDDTIGYVAFPLWHAPSLPASPFRMVDQMCLPQCFLDMWQITHIPYHNRKVALDGYFCYWVMLMLVKTWQSFSILSC